MATLYGSGKGLVRVMAGLQILIGILLVMFGVICAVMICHWTSKAGLGIWIGIIVLITACIGLYSCFVAGQEMITWYSLLSILCAILSVILCVSYGTAMADFHDEIKSDTSPVDNFYSRRFIAVYMRTHYYENCVSTARKEEIERERTGYLNVENEEQDEEFKLLSEMRIHGRNGLGFAATMMGLAALEFVFACASVIYSCTAAGWLVKKSTNAPAKSQVTIHHSQAASQVLVR